MKGVLTIFLFFVVATVACADDRVADKAVSGHHIDGVSISPDGRYLALIVSGGNDVQYVATVDRQQPAPPKPIMQLDPKQHTTLKWCKWAKESRILCNITSSHFPVFKGTDDHGYFTSLQYYYGAGRLIAFDADGGQLITFSRLAIEYWGVANWVPDDPDNILVLLPSDSWIDKRYDSRLFWLNTKDGEANDATPSRDWGGTYGTDSKGRLRLIVRNIPNNKGPELFTKQLDSKDWKEIPKDHVTLKDGPHHLFPQSILSETDEAYAIGDYRGHEALWKIDLTGSKDIELVFAQPGVDVHSIIGPDHQLLGVSYGTDKPTIKYFDIDAQILQDTADKVLPNRNNQLVDFSRDMKVAVVQSQIDKDQTVFYVLDMSTRPAHLTPLK